MSSYFSYHNHTYYSNIRLLDAINSPKKLIDTAIKLGLSGVAITDHEVLAAHVEAEKYYNEIKEKYPDFKLAFGNEIYLVDKKGSGQKYYHFILIAKDAIGYRALKELSTKAWLESYTDRKMERVPTTKADLIEVVSKFKGHLIATTACIGGELPQLIMLYKTAQKIGDMDNARLYYNKILEFIDFCQRLFGEDFYLECAPGNSPEQILVNQTLLSISLVTHTTVVVATDAHYARPEDRPIHKAYLNSKEGDREVDAFYEFTYLMSYDELKELLIQSIHEENWADVIIKNTLEIQDKIQPFSLFRKQNIPSVEVKNYPRGGFGNNNPYADEMEKFPNLKYLLASEDIQDRYWVNQCWDKLNELGKGWNHLLETGDDTYLARLEEEARVKRIIGEKLETNMFRYPNTLQHYIDLMWECGSMVGAGRGSSCAALNHYLMGITQLDPIVWNLPFFRYLNDERVELGDIDLDLCPSKVGIVIKKIAEERSKMFNDDVPQWAKDNLGCVRIATFGTEGTKSAILTACRGYRSDDYPDGIDVDQAQYMASLIPSERGFLWDIDDVINGNEEKNRKPIPTFIREVSKYPGLLEIIMGINSVINKRSSHASGVILLDGDPFEYCAFMRTPKGEIISQFNLHDVEYCGATKYDFLVTEVQDKLVQTIQLLQEDGEIEKNLSLKEVYDKYFHPNVLPINDEKIWEALGNVSVINTFQFDSQVGAQVAKKLKPHSIQEMSSANGLMRLMGEEDEERPLDKYYKQKNDISLWYKEMDREGLTKEEQKTLEPYFLADYGVPPDQESLMLMLMDKNICDFSLADANAARKIVGKKQMKKIPALRQQVLDQAKSPALGRYVWKHGCGPQMGYSFSRIHALAYSFIGAQTLYIATHWNPIYWDTACLIVNSGSLEEDEEDFEEEEETESKNTSTDYGKVAKALGDIISAGIKVSTVDINRSGFGFKPDIENNQILFGMKALLNVNDDVVKDIIAKRPYVSPKDFYYKVNPKKQAMVSLIKSGAFDNMMERKLCMAWFIWETCDKKSRLTLQNLPGLIRYNLLPEDTDERIMARRVYEFNRYLKAVCKNKESPTWYFLDARAISFLQEMGYDALIQENEFLEIKVWEKEYQHWMDIFREWIASDKEAILNNLNGLIFKQDWDKYAEGNYSSWEMEAMCFYYHDHELKDINFQKYGISDFFKLPENPEVERTFTKAGKTINIFKLYRICGTCIAKNKVKSSVSLLTPTGVVNVKFRKEYFALFDKQISEKQEDGTKKVKEKSWFNRGQMIVVQGIRSGDDFITKKYASSAGHQLYKINKIVNNTDLELTTERYGAE